MKVIVTGSEGFIGSNLCTHLKSKKVTVIKYDLKKNKKNVFIEKNLKKIDGVIHLAGVSRVSHSIKYPLNTVNSNILLTTKILDHLKTLKQKPWFIFASTQQIQKEKFLKQKSPYAISKQTCEELIKFYALNFKIKSYIIRLSDVFGIKNYDTKKSLGKMINNLKKDKNFEINNDNHFFNFIDINQFSKIIWSIMNKKNKFLCTILNIESLNKIKISNLAYAIKKKIKSNSKIIFKTEKIFQNNQNKINEIKLKFDFNILKNF